MPLNSINYTLCDDIKNNHLALLCCILLLLLLLYITCMESLSKHIFSQLHGDSWVHKGEAMEMWPNQAGTRLFCFLAHASFLDRAGIFKILGGVWQEKCNFVITTTWNRPDFPFYCYFKQGTFFFLFQPSV